MHFALEEAYGYFEGPISVAPHLNGCAQMLRAQHKDLHLESCDIFEQAEQLSYWKTRAVLLDEIVQRVNSFFDQLQIHESRENELIARAYNEDLGVGD
jgi:hypothetical protein